MELYIVSGSPNCRKAQAVINYLGLPVEIKTLGFFSGDLKTDEYFAINPNRLVPALINGSIKLWESNAISQFLASTTPPGPLFPDDLATRADITRWQFWEANHYNRAVGTLVWENLIKPKFDLGEPDPTAVEKGTEDFHRFAAVLDAHLEGKEFIVGSGVTLADFSVGALAGMVGPGKVPVEDYPNIAAWYARLDTIPAWAECAPSLDKMG